MQIISMKDLQGSIKTTSTVKGYQTSLQVQNNRSRKVVDWVEEEKKIKGYGWLIG